MISRAITHVIVHMVRHIILQTINVPQIMPHLIPRLFPATVIKCQYKHHNNWLTYLLSLSQHTCLTPVAGVTCHAGATERIHVISAVGFIHTGTAVTFIDI